MGNEVGGDLVCNEVGNDLVGDEIGRTSCVMKFGKVEGREFSVP